MTAHPTLRQVVAVRLREVRIDRFGGDDADQAALADALGLAPATWRNFEAGVAMPAEVLLAFIEATRVNPHWLLTGTGDRYAVELGSKFLGKH